MKRGSAFLLPAAAQQQPPRRVIREQLILLQPRTVRCSRETGKLAFIPPLGGSTINDVGKHFGCFATLLLRLCTFGI